jgi:hypothetical protein
MPSVNPPRGEHICARCGEVIDPTLECVSYSREHGPIHGKCLETDNLRKRFVRAGWVINNTTKYLTWWVSPDKQRQAVVEHQCDSDGLPIPGTHRVVQGNAP